MAFGLTIGTERSAALQNSIQDELTARGYSPDADPVMAEYITIMIINNKTPVQITAELQELIGPDFDSSFVDWLFQEASKGSPEAETPAPSSTAATSTPAAQPSQPPQNQPSSPSQPPTQDTRRRPLGGGVGLYQQALSSALPSGAKRTRSPSPSSGSHANKVRRTSDLPTGPRAMQSAGGGGGRSLLERMGGRYKDDIQARIDNITAGGIPPEMFPPMPMGMNGMPMPPMNGMAPPPPMDMNIPGMVPNQVMLQEMMMNQMAIMAQMAGAMGMLGPQFPGGPVPQQGFSVPGMEVNGDGRGRGGARGRGRGMGGGGRGGGGGGGRGGHAQAAPPFPQSEAEASAAPVAPIPTPAPMPAPQAPQPAYARPPTHTQAHVTPPARPLSPTLCKFGLNCTNAMCRWSHPSPVATVESGVVLSNDPCEKGVNCVDKDCVKAHVSPAAARMKDGTTPNAPTPTTTTTPASKPPPTASPSSLNPSAPSFSPTSAAPATTTPQATIPCRYGIACTRPGCAYAHPLGHVPPPFHAHPHAHPQYHRPTTTTPCRFGAACTRATCPFVHPEGRGVLPGTFHRGLDGKLGAGAAGGADGASPHRSVTFNKPGALAATASKDGVGKEDVGAAKEGEREGTEEGGKDTAADLERRVREVEQLKIEAQSALKEAEARRRATTTAGAAPEVEAVKANGKA